MRKVLLVILAFFVLTSNLACQRPRKAALAPFLPKKKATQEKVELPKIKQAKFHPQHQMIVWTTRYKERIFRVIKLPRCEHLETIITYFPEGETKEQARNRLGGIASCSAAFYDPKTNKPVDYFRKDGHKITGRAVGRWFLAIFPDGSLEISGDHSLLGKNPTINALSLGQRLVPFHHDSFSVGFANLLTDRMALSFSQHYLYIVQGKSNLWLMGRFIKDKLYSTEAINTDGGHSVKGRSPFHLVFRWKTDQ